MAAQIEFGRDSLASSMNLWAATLKSRQLQQSRAAIKQKHNAGDQNLLKKIFSSVKAAPRQQQQAAPKKTCVCAPTSHPGSFRCRLHRNEQTPLEEKAEQRRHSSASNRKRFFSGIGTQTNKPRPSRFHNGAVEEADRAAFESVSENAEDISLS
ncbi:hypothetical protein H6P81_014078 [Aristolochia fimbriata]|uniref:Uncharacterized protein n=1 Tax=Aristolochia fimbriata TaxID=158543 RepID=A0AAV7EGI1_ARIFI|nr:hypothetical protein H6P81_014078 [Aristolochia fimbriata]